MKHVLVVDTEMTVDGKHICDSCPIWNKETHYCEYDRNTGNKGCPLRPFPKEKEATEQRMKSLTGVYVIAWNECLSKITGETE